MQRSKIFEPVPCNVTGQFFRETTDGIGNESLGPNLYEITGKSNLHLGEKLSYDLTRVLTLNN